MRDGSRQLVLDLPLETRFGREDFLVSASNQAAFDLVESWPHWSDTVLQLTGPEGSGKSHLAAVWAERAGARIIAAGAVTADLVPELGDATALVLEDVDRGPLDEPALFHLVNLARERRHHILFTTSRVLDPALIRTPDLLSRLRLAPSARLGSPDDELLRAVFVKLFADRQLAVDASVVAYLALRIERSLARAAEVVRELDREGLSRARPITRVIAAQILDAGSTSSELEDEASS
jgi:chromosomal replication initiation ATPase DnaA